MIMLGSVVDTDFGRMMKQPKEVGGAETQCPYVVVADADAHYARAKAAGAQIVMDIRTKTTVAAATRAEISKAICGASAPTILGPAIEAARAADPAANSTPYPSNVTTDIEGRRPPRAVRARPPSSRGEDQRLVFFASR
jgi:hypothetical protein